LPFEQVVELVQPERDASRTPLVQVMFALQNSPRHDIILEGVQAEVVPHTTITATFDLFLELIPVAEGLHASCEYNTDLYDATTVTRLLTHFQILLEGLMAQPDTYVGDLSMLSAAEWQQFRAWNATDVAYPSTRCVHDLVAEQAARTPAAIALVADSTQMSYQVLDQRANQLAHLLRGRGVGPEVVVGLCLDRSIDLVVAQLAVLKAGGAFLPLDPSAPSDRLAFILADAQVALLLTTATTAPAHLPANLPVFWLDHDADQLDAAPSDPITSQATPANLAYLIYTSGSTGRPKGVTVPHAGLVNLIHWHQQTYAVRPSDRATLVASPAFDASIWELWPYLARGARLVIPDTATRTMPAALVPWLCAQGITLCFLPTALAEAVLTQPWPATTTLRMLLVGGDQLHPIPTHLPFLVVNHYGPTETTVMATAQHVEPGSAAGLPPIGSPIANIEVYLLDRRGQPIPIGVAGELYIGGVGVARGYRNRPELTAEKFVPNPFSAEPGRRLYRTGDLARYREDGTIEFLGRIDQQVKIRGFRIELGEIEQVIGEHPAVQDTVVLVREDLPGQKQIVAYLVPNAHYADTDALLAESETEYIASWQQLYDDTYGQTSAETEATFNITGWNSSYTGLPMAAAELQEQVEQVVARVLAHQPKRVLEIGVGTGLLLFRIAPHCTAYWGTDFSTAAIKVVSHEVAQQGLTQVRLLQRLADDLSGLDAEPFDLVLINSVAQYFPNADYLHTVVAQAVQHVRPGGCVLLGDLRSYPLLETYHSSVQLYQAAPSLSTADLAQRITSRVAGEEELVIDPAFFHTLQQQSDRISQVEVQLRRGQYANELTKFRYDVLLHVERAVTTVAAQPFDWQRDDLSLDRLRALLTQDAPDVLLVRDVPNARVWADVQAQRLLAGDDRPATVAALRAAAGAAADTAVDPEALWGLGAELGYHTEVGWAESEIGMLQVAFRRTAHSYGAVEGALGRAKPLAACTNAPTYGKLKRKLVPQVRAHLTTNLPDYMVPAAFVVLDALPLTPNGKIDRKALPAPSGIVHDDEQQFVAPRTPLETQVAEVWTELFGVERVGIHDDFFALGGHSLLAIQLTATIKRTFGVDLPLRELFTAPTIAGCVAVLEQALAPHTDEATATVIDLIADTALDLTIQPVEHTAWFTAAPQALFLTGATGFLGAFLLHELLRTTEATVHCLVHAKTLDAAWTQLRATLEQNELWDAALAPRIVPVLGDLAQPRLGLSATGFAALAEQLDGVYHSGALVNLLYPYAALRATNVLGTQEAIRLACAGKRKPLHYISTLGVASTAQLGADGRIHEDAALGPVDSVDGGYVQSKWVAEHLVLTAKERGLPVYIYRPSHIMGHSETGASNLDDFMLRLLVGTVQLGSAPEIAKDENMVPVDYVAQTIVRLSLQRDLAGQIFHVMNPQWNTFNEVAQAVRQAGFAVEVLPFALWYNQLLAAATSEQANVLYCLLPYLAQMPTEQAWINHLSTPDFACHNTLQGLAGSGIACPTFGPRHIEATLAYFVRRGVLSANLVTERVNQTNQRHVGWSD
jgi:amino acid adenylation domain-containing protein/thioester reductase-like protein